MTSIHDRLSLGHRPHVSITVPTGAGDTEMEREIPFVIGVLGDFSGRDDPAEQTSQDLTVLDLGGEDWEAAVGNLGVGNDADRSRSPLWSGVRLLMAGLCAEAPVKVRLVDVAKPALSRDLLTARCAEDTALFRCLHDGAQTLTEPDPFALLVGAYAFSAQPDDVAMLGVLSRIAATAHAPFIAAADPAMFDAASFHTLPDTDGATRLSEDAARAPWRAFRDTEFSAFVALALPSVAAKFGGSVENAETGGINPAFAVASRLTAYFQRDGSWTAMADTAPRWDTDPAAGAQPVLHPEAGIPEILADELAAEGFLVLRHGNGPDDPDARAGELTVGTTTCHSPKQNDRPEVAADATIAARLPFILTTSRFLLTLRIMARGWLARFGATECEARLNQWLLRYVDGNPHASDETKVRYPLAEARLVIKEVPGEPGARDLVVWLRPWLRGEALDTSAQLSIRVPR